MQKRPDLGSGSVGRLLVRLAVPTITAQLVNMLYNLVDRIYIGHIPGIGTQALTGVGVCLPIIMMISAFASLAAMGGAPLASIELGKGEREQAERMLGSSAALLTGLSVTLTIILSIWHEPMLLAFGANEETILYAARYMRIYSFGTVFVQLALGLNAFITAQGFTTVSMLTVLIGALLNTVLDPLFIFVLGMDVQGAALATILSQAVSAVWVVAFLRGKKTFLRLTPACFRLDWPLLRKSVALGLSPFIMQSTDSLMTVCFNSSLLHYGGTLAVGAMTICASAMQFVLLPINGLTQGASPIISYNYGAGKPQRVRKTFKLLLISCVGYSTAMWAVTTFAPQVFVGLFTPDPELQAYAIPCVRLYMSAILIFGAQCACQNTFVALGNAKCSFFLACLRKLILLIPLIYILPNFFEDKVMAVFLAEPVADVLAVLSTVTLFSFVFRKTMRRLEEAAPASKGSRGDASCGVQG
ncbi:MAG: MATE family efflux transporter [Aristaeellaceae bacterium]